MGNVHAPERLEGETQQQYRERQAASRAALTALTNPVLYGPFVQHTNPKRSAERLLRDAKGGRRQFRRIKKHARYLPVAA
jgi:hypothetical protein